MTQKHLQRNGGHHAVHKGGAGAQADQRPHIGTAVDHGLPATGERTASRAQSTMGVAMTINPALNGHVHPLKPMTKHRQHKTIAVNGKVHQNRRWKSRNSGYRRHRDPAAGLQCHAALGAVAGMVLLHLRMHWAGVNRTGKRPLLVSEAANQPFAAGATYLAGSMANLSGHSRCRK